jgi:hypothetical protein
MRERMRSSAAWSRASWRCATPDLRAQLARLERSQRRTAAAVVFAAFLLTAAQLYLAGSLLLAGLAAGGALTALIALLLSPLSRESCTIAVCAVCRKGGPLW